MYSSSASSVLVVAAIALKASVPADVVAGVDAEPSATGAATDSVVAGENSVRDDPAVAVTTDSEAASTFE